MRHWRRNAKKSKVDQAIDKFEDALGERLIYALEASDAYELSRSEQKEFAKELGQILGEAVANILREMSEEPE